MALRAPRRQCHLYPPFLVWHQGKEERGKFCPLYRPQRQSNQLRSPSDGVPSSPPPAVPSSPLPPLHRDFQLGTSRRRGRADNELSEVDSPAELSDDEFTGLPPPAFIINGIRAETAKITPKQRRSSMGTLRTKMSRETVGLGGGSSRRASATASPLFVPQNLLTSGPANPLHPVNNKSQRNGDQSRSKRRRVALGPIDDETSTYKEMTLSQGILTASPLVPIEQILCTDNRRLATRELRGPEDAASVVKSETSIAVSRPPPPVKQQSKDSGNLATKPTCKLALVCYRSGASGCKMHHILCAAKKRYEDDKAFEAACRKNPQLIASDTEFFHALEEAYRMKMCSIWRRLFFLKTLRGLRVLTYTNDTRPTVVPFDDMVLQEVFYAYKRPDTIETEHEWIDWVFALRQPDKLHALEFVEGWNGTRIAIAGTIPFFFSTMVGLVWSIRSGDWQTAFTVAGFILTAGTLLLALLAVVSGIEASGKAATFS